MKDKQISWSDIVTQKDERARKNLFHDKIIEMILAKPKNDIDKKEK